MASCSLAFSWPMNSARRWGRSLSSTASSSSTLPGETRRSASALFFLFAMSTRGDGKAKLAAMQSGLPITDLILPLRDGRDSGGAAGVQPSARLFKHSPSAGTRKEPMKTFGIRTVVVLAIVLLTGSPVRSIAQEPARVDSATSKRITVDVVVDAKGSKPPA